MLPVVTTLTRPLHTALTTLTTVKSEVRVDYDSDDAVLTRQIAQASATIARITRRTWARGRYREFLHPLDGHLWVSRPPVVTVEALAWADRDAVTSEPITEYDVIEEGVSLWTAQRRGTVTTGYQVDYAGGYLVPDDDLSRVPTISAAAFDNSLTDSAAGFPLLAAGDVPTLSGLTQLAGAAVPVTVVSRTVSTLVLSGLTLTDEDPGAEVSLVVRTLPEDVELACLELVKAQYLSRQFHLTGPRLVETGAGTQALQDPGGAIPRIVWALLRPWREVYV